HGTCTHVYNYAQSAACLFPDLERSARTVEFLQETDENGVMAFRSQTPFGWPRSSAEPAIDGQFGTIVRLCREWKQSGDGQWLEKLWPKAKAALDFGLLHWDHDGDGLAEARQHNTYDIEFYGANPLGTSMMLAALTAGIAMARFLGDSAAADRWEVRLAQGRAKMQERLFNGRYYRQLPADRPDYRYQPGNGCLADQLVGQFMADCAGLGALLDPDQIRSALLAIVQNNFCESFYDRPSLHRTYALNDEQGLLLCTWPDGDRPAMPMPYADEVWSGVTYSVAAMLLRRGLTDEAVKLVAAVNRRHDGLRRNPFNEAECGHHYARSMASWALVSAWTGMQPDLPGGRISFAPAFTGSGLAFFCCAKAWGLLGCLNGSWTAYVLGGSLDGLYVTVLQQSINIVTGWPTEDTMRDMQGCCAVFGKNNGK
ncbi:MAG: GH116 family glycosyl hydrolase, partial [Bacillota bacterium]|nr:GH116 family glycosyl hydrolase [Bacillota bacterium]